MALLLPVGTSRAVERKEADLVHYEIHPGDTLYDLAQAHFLRLEDYRAVQRLNRIADPHRLHVGKILKIPRPLLRFLSVPAKVLAFRGAVAIERRGRSLPATLRSLVHESDVIETGANGFLSLGLADGSVITLPSQSRVRVERMRRLSLTGTVDRRFFIVGGQVRGKIRPQKADDLFRFGTPSSVSAVRGTELRVSYRSNEQRATTEVLEGLVDVQTKGDIAVRSVPAGFATISTGHQIGPIRALLSPPLLNNPDMLQDGDELAFEINRVEGAVAYRIEVAEDAGFINIVGSNISPGPKLSLPSIEDGIWFVRATAIDALGLEGPGTIYSFRRRLHGIRTDVETRTIDGTRHYLFRWNSTGLGTMRFRFQLSSKGYPEQLIDIPGLSGDTVSVADLNPGTYIWRVETKQFLNGEVHSKWSLPESLIVTPK